MILNMKKIFFILFLFSSYFTYAQSNDVINNIKVAFKTGSSNELAKHIASSIDLKILDKEGIYSSSQAKLILKDFFAKHPPMSYHVVHEGKSEDQMKYFIGTLISKEISFRVYIYLKTNSEKSTIQELSIEEEE